MAPSPELRHHPAGQAADAEAEHGVPTGFHGKQPRQEQQCQQGGKHQLVLGAGAGGQREGAGAAVKPPAQPVFRGEGGNGKVKVGWV